MVLPIWPSFGSFGELALSVLAERIDANWRERDCARGVVGLGRDELAVGLPSLTRNWTGCALAGTSFRELFKALPEHINVIQQRFREGECVF